MKCKIAIFDIDGTLVPLKETQPNAELAAAIARLQSKGIYIIVATGRVSSSAQKMLPNIKYDYLVSSNGQEVFDAQNSCLYAHTMTAAQKTILLSYCRRHRLPLSFSFSGGHSVVCEYEKYRALYTHNIAPDEQEPLIENGEKVEHAELPFTGCVWASQAQVDAFIKEAPQAELCFMPFAAQSYDVVPNGVNKAHSIEKLLHSLGASWQEVLAVGDGENDIAMITKAGYGLAVGSPCDALRKAAKKTVPQNQLAQFLCDFATANGN